jgi:uncharacterized protein involved in outer membrane biogenesis
MRKQIGVAVAGLTCLLIVAALSLNVLVERNKEYLLGRLAQAIGHSISATKIEISYNPLTLRMADLAIAGDPGDSANPLVLAKNMQIKLRVLPLIIGRFQPAEIISDAPMITIVRDADGRYNYEHQAGERKRERNRSNRSEQSSDDRRPLAIAAVQITNGTLRYRDVKNDDELVVSQIDLRISDFDEDAPVEMRLAAAVMTAKPNLSFNIRVGPIAGIRDYRNYPIEGRLDAEQLDLGKVNRALPRFRRATPKHLRFDGIYDIKDLKFKGTLNNPSLQGAVSGTDASFRFD